jgi:hypothetical protein
VIPENDPHNTLFDAQSVELLRHLVRTSVDIRDATPHLHEIAEPVEHQLIDVDFEVILTFDLSGTLETLRGLPDLAGTAAFVAAYNARFARPLDH